MPSTLELTKRLGRELERPCLISTLRAKGSRELEARPGCFERGKVRQGALEEGGRLREAALVGEQLRLGEFYVRDEGRVGAKGLGANAACRFELPAGPREMAEARFGQAKMQQGARGRERGGLGASMVYGQ